MQEINYFYLSWGLFIIAVTGAISNIKKRAACFAVWSLSNTGWMLYNFSRGEGAQAAQNLIFLSTSLYGIWEWGGRRAITRNPAICTIVNSVFHNSKIK